MHADEARENRRAPAAGPPAYRDLACYPETRIGAFDFSAATCTEPLGYGSADGQRACGDSWPGMTEDLFLFTQEDPVQDRWREFIVQQDSAYAYVWNAPTAFKDPMGLYTLGDGVPSLTPDGDFFMNCLEICTGRPITVTASSNGRHADPGHAGGTSFDIRPNGAPSKTVFCCARFCGAPYVLDERTRKTKFGTGAHYHFQLVPPRKPRPSAPNSIPPCPGDCPPIP